jgi:hypothetical protein
VEDAPTLDVAAAVLLSGLKSFAGAIPEEHHNGFIPAVV